MKKSMGFIAVIAAIILSGCGAHMHNPRESTASLVYGYIDMDDAPSDADWVTIRQYKPKPKDDKPYLSAKGVHGMFWFDQLVPGSYQLVAFGGSSCWKNAAYDYNMQDFSKNETALVFAKPGLYFMGSYKFKKAGTFWKPAFEIDRTDSPAEKEVLQRMLPYSTDTQWEKMIKKRIERLK